MKLKHLLLLIAALCLYDCQDNNIPLYIGTFTDVESEGIYKIQFDSNSGTLNNLELVAKTTSPSFLTYSPNRNYIYAACRVDGGIIASYKIQDNGSLQFINSVSSNGELPCHVAVNPSGTKIATSNYRGGTISINNINKDGSLSEEAQVFNHNSPNQPSHTHSAQFSGNSLFVADLGRNGLYQYQATNHNQYQLKTASIVNMENGAGPRHFTITKNKTFIYIINELNSSITTAKKEGNSYKLVNHVSTLSDNYQGDNACADIHLSQDERFLYGSNRGENSIVVFKRDTETGVLEKVQNISTHGDWPRNFTLDPTGKFLLVANRKSHNISVFGIDPHTGKLEFLNDYKAPSPVCLLF